MSRWNWPALRLICALMTVLLATGGPAAVLSQDMFERARSVGRKHVEATVAPTPQGQGRYYVVQDGDSLWKIATSQLGNGARYPDIVKLNADHLSDENSLKIGTRLRMPSK